MIFAPLQFCGYCGTSSLVPQAQQVIVVLAEQTESLIAHRCSGCGTTSYVSAADAERAASRRDSERAAAAREVMVRAFADTGLEIEDGKAEPRVNPDGSVWLSVRVLVPAALTTSR